MAKVDKNKKGKSKDKPEKKVKPAKPAGKAPRSAVSCAMQSARHRPAATALRSARTYVC